MPIPSRMNLIAQSRAARASERAAAEERAWREKMQWRELGMNALGNVLGLGFGAAGKAIGNAIDAPKERAKAEADFKKWQLDTALVGLDESRRTLDPVKVNEDAAETYRSQTTFGQEGAQRFDRRSIDTALRNAMSDMGPPIEASRLPRAPEQAADTSPKKRPVESVALARRPSETDAADVPGKRTPEGPAFSGYMQEQRIPGVRAEPFYEPMSEVRTTASAEPPDAAPKPPRPVSEDTGFTGTRPVQPLGEDARRLAREMAVQNPANATYASDYDRKIAELAARRRGAELTNIGYREALTDKALRPPPTDPLERAKYAREAITGTNKEVRATNPHDWRTARAAEQVISNNGGRFVERMSFRTAYRNGRVNAEDVSDVQREILAAGGDFVVTVPMRPEDIDSFNRARAESKRRLGRTGTGKGGAVGGDAADVRWLERGYKPGNVAIMVQDVNKDGDRIMKRATVKMDRGLVNMVARNPTPYVRGEDALEARALAQELMTLGDGKGAPNPDRMSEVQARLMALMNSQMSDVAALTAESTFSASPGSSAGAGVAAETKEQEAERKRLERENAAAEKDRGRLASAYRSGLAAFDAKTSLDYENIDKSLAARHGGAKMEYGQGVVNMKSALAAAPKNGADPILHKIWNEREAMRAKADADRRVMAAEVVRLGKAAGMQPEEIRKQLLQRGVDPRTFIRDFDAPGQAAPGPSAPAAPQPRQPEDESRGDQSSAGPPPEVQAAHARINAMPISAAQKKRIWFSWLAQNGYGEANA